LILFLLTTPIFAKWALVPLDELVAESDLIVIGTLHSAFENEEGLGSGQILVEKIITEGAKTQEGSQLMPGDNLKINWSDNWACAAGTHVGRVNKKGIYLLNVQLNGTVSAAYPGRFIEVAELGQVTRFLKRQKDKKSAKVDVAKEQLPKLAEPSKTYLLSHESIPSTPIDDLASLRAGLVLLFSFGLYLFMYKSRFRIR